MDDKAYRRVRAALLAKPLRLDDLDLWLFVTVNTAKAIIDNSSKQDLEKVHGLADCHRVRELQLAFDMVQGRFGREDFSWRHSPAYLYLCRLVADFPDQELTEWERELIHEYSAADTYLLYEL